MRKLLTHSLLLVLLGTPLAACGGGYSADDAREECERLRALPPADNTCDDAWDDAALLACTSCFEDCGDTCAFADTVCPIDRAFSCPQ